MRPIRHAIRALPALAVAALTLAACGGAADAGAGGGTSADDRDAARIRFQQCMRDNGVELPGRRDGAGGGAPGNIDSEKLRKAQEACSEFREQARGELTDEQRQEFRDAFTKFASCMRKEGVDLPTPTGTGPGGGVRRALRIDRESPKVQAALKACEDVLPRRRGGGPGGGGPGPGGGVAGQ